MHYAVHGNTAAEVIYNRVDSNKENIGLTNFKGDMPTKAETEVAKNYLTEKELQILNRMKSIGRRYEKIKVNENKNMSEED